MNKYEKKFKQLNKKKYLSKKEECLKLKNFLKWKGDKTNSYAYFFDFEISEINFVNKTILDLDKDEYIFQKESGTLVSNTYSTLYLNDIQVGFIEKDFISRPVNGNIISAQYYILDKVIDKLEKYIAKLYPFIFKTFYGEKYFTKTEDGNYRLTHEPEIVAMGKEKEYHKANKLLRDMYWEIFDFIEILTKKHNIINFTFVNEFDFCNKTYIIGGIPAAEKIKYDSFLVDFYKLEQTEEYLKRIVSKTYKKFKKLLNKKIGKI